MVNEPYAGATSEQLQHHLVQEFLTIHDMFRNQLAAIIRYVDDLTAGETQLNAPETRIRIQALIRAGTQYTQLLHFHHHGETSALFPALQEEGLADEVVTRLNADHDEIAVMIDSFHDRIHQFATIDPDVMQNDLRRLADALRDHLAYEESHVCPLMTRWSRWPLH